MAEETNFIYNFIRDDIAEGGQYEGQTVHTRFPPEPNGYLHIGHCKALCIDFGMAEKFGGMCNLRMDDTNPAKEDTEYVDAIKQDIHWLGFDWGDRFFYGSDYFEKDYEYAVELIKKGLAYVCELTPEEFKANRGDTTTGAKSPYRDRPIEENLELFEKMKNGEIEEGKMTLRAKIDLNSGNFNMRDPVIYRIRYINHHRQGTKWCIFPMYDFAHPIQDALEGITHSLCSLEYEDHRPLYDWVVNNVSIPYHKPRQIEFARLGIDHTVMSKRKLRQQPILSEPIPTSILEMPSWNWEQARLLYPSLTKKVRPPLLNEPRFCSRSVRLVQSPMHNATRLSSHHASSASMTL